MKKLRFGVAAGLAGFLLSPAQAEDAIRRPQGVTLEKAIQASDDAAQGADKQRDLIKQKRKLRKPQVPAGKVQPAVANPIPPALRQQLLRGLSPADQLRPGLARLGTVLRDMQKAHGRNSEDTRALRGKAAQAREELGQLRELARGLAAGFAEAERHVPSAGGKQAAERLRNSFDAMLRDLEAQDKMGNFEIQRLMSQYNQAEQLASSVQKKKDDTENAIIGKVG